jgi:hypothetical protein
MRSTLCALMVIALVGFASTAGAYDFLYTGDKAATHDAGSFGLKVGVVYLMADKGFDADGESYNYEDFWGPDAKATHMSIPISVYYAVADQFEIGVQPKFIMDSATWDEVDYEATGLGDTWINVKYMFMPEPMMTARLGVKVATGDSEGDSDNGPTGDGQMDIDGAVLFGVPAGPGSFDAAVGYRMRMENSDTKLKPGSEIHFAGCYSFFMSDMMALKLAADGYFGSDWANDGETIDESSSNIVFVNPGIDYTMESGMTLGAGFHYPLMGTSEEAAWGADVYVGWGK